MDVQDELMTIQGVLFKQRDVLYKFLNLLSDDPDKDRTDDASDIVDTPESSQYGAPMFEDAYPFESPDARMEKQPLPSALYRDGAKPKVKRNVQFADERTSYPKSKTWKQAKKNFDLVQSNIDTIKEMIHYAGKVQVEVGFCFAAYFLSLLTKVSDQRASQPSPEASQRVGSQVRPRGLGTHAAPEQCKIHVIPCATFWLGGN
jgi:hypothetical protein